MAKPGHDWFWFLLLGEQQEEVVDAPAADLEGEASEEEPAASDASPSANEIERPWITAAGSSSAWPCESDRAPRSCETGRAEEEALMGAATSTMTPSISASVD